MSRHKVRMAITGKGASPETVPLHDLAEILASIERLVLACADVATVELPHQAPVSLVGIEESSAGLVLSVEDPHVCAVSRVSNAVATGDYLELPETALLELRKLTRSVERREWEFEIRENQDLGITYVRVESKSLPAMAEHGSVEGTSTIYGRCLRVGGATKPKAEIRLSSSGQILNVELSETEAKELAKRLYEEVILEGRATWDVETWEVERFRVSHITPYRQTDPALAFKELAEAAHGQWKGVDAAEYVRSLRSED